MGLSPDDHTDRLYIDSEPLEVEIELEGPSVVPTRQARPAIARWLGNAPPSSTRPAVYCRAPAMAAMLAHAWSTTEREVGGIVVGEVFVDDAPYIVLTQAIAASHNYEGRARLTFTPASWQQMLAEKEERCPSARILGWYHTHPGYGIFLSEQDRYIQRNFFSLPCQIALVFDPCARTFGYFGWSGQTLAARHTLAICGDARELAQDVTVRNQEQALPPPREQQTIVLDDALDELAHSIYAGCELFGQTVGEALADCLRPLEGAVEPQSPTPGRTPGRPPERENR